MCCLTVASSAVTWAALIRSAFSDGVGRSATTVRLEWKSVLRTFKN